MKPLDIRQRMLVAALLPVMLVSVLLSVVFLVARFDDMQESYLQRTRSITRQLALASEYGLFSANQTQLQSVMQGAMREQDVRWAAVLDKDGRILASAGDQADISFTSVSAVETEKYDAQRQLDVLAQPVFASGLKLDDLYNDAALPPDGLPVQLGQVVVKFSRQTVSERKQHMLLLGGLISFAGLVFGLLLAARLSQGVIRPILRVTQLIERIGRGDFSAASDLNQVAVSASDPLRDLQENLRQMAERLSFAREDLEHQVAVATHALREKKEEAELATQAKSRFLAAASHDLRQPTHALGMFVSRLAQLPHDTQTRELIGSLDASVRAMQNLLDGLLDISRLEAQAVQVKLAPLPLAGLLNQLQHDLQQSAIQKSLRLRIRTSPVWVLSDAVLLYRILLNLVSNALRYTDQGGVLVACRWLPGGETVQLQVWDSGVGIAPEHQTEVFKEFFQVANSARERHKGLGLGLSIVKRTADLLGVPVTLTSRLGMGTRFTLTLPVVNPNMLAETIEPAELAVPNVPESGEILVIEDDVLVRAALSGLLSGWGFTVHQAQSLKDAQMLLQEHLKPALILSDYRLLDGENGIEVVQALRAQLGNQVPACLMSGDTDAGLMLAAKAAGLTLLHKPVRPAKLRSLLRRLLSHQPIEEDLR
ncbi:ATP-binding protein [Rhodoferax sp.]|uniref:hybrid sensor histidine kinase/response regulator n=1 Tax=Rhodoferax sp. TaxID=50421 RepID=UPI00260F81B9|nr:ATP-binding protein [Rhodoferax sp.]MDD2811317.1 ATP-binding protein [Rhodoferax sp.]MDD5480193.1 ATP-binding protein [Rhodoferax sp.]